MLTDAELEEMAHWSMRGGGERWQRLVAEQRACRTAIRKAMDDAVFDEEQGFYGLRHSYFDLLDCLPETHES